MNLLAIRTLALNWLDDKQAGYFDVATVNTWINNAQKEVQKRLIKANQNYYLRAIKTSLVVNQTDYVLPDDFLKLHRLEIVISGVVPNEVVTPLYPITTNQQDLVVTLGGQPQCYRLKRNRLVVQPTPTTIQVMRMIYSYAVTDMVLDTDLPDCPEQYHELLALLAAQDGFIKDGRASELLIKKLAEYERDMDNDAQERNQDLPRNITETGNDITGGYYW